MTEIVWHCEVIDIEHWYRLGCTNPAEDIYVDVDGVRHGYCLRHRQLGHIESAKRGWAEIIEFEEAA